MAAFLSLVPAGDFVRAPVTDVRARLRLVSGGLAPRPARPLARWHRAVDGTLLCRWQSGDDDPLA